MKQVRTTLQSERDVLSEIDDSRRLMFWTAVIALTVFCATAVSAIGGWIPNALGHTGNNFPAARNTWWGSNTTQPLAVQVRPAFFTAPADYTQVNATPKTTKG